MKAPTRMLPGLRRTNVFFWGGRVVYKNPSFFFFFLERRRKFIFSPFFLGGSSPVFAVGWSLPSSPLRHKAPASAKFFLGTPWESLNCVLSLYHELRINFGLYFLGLEVSPLCRELHAILSTLYSWLLPFHPKESSCLLIWIVFWSFFSFSHSSQYSEYSQYPDSRCEGEPLHSPLSPRWSSVK